MLSRHERITGTCTLSCHGKIMEKKKKEGSMPKDSLVAELKSWSIKRKQRDTSLRPPSKTEDHWSFCITKPCKGEEKASSRRHPTHRSNSYLTFPHHQAVHVSSVMSWVVICHITIVDHVYCIQMYCKVELQRTHMNVKIHVSWKFIGSQIVMRVVKEWPLVIYIPSLYEQRNFSPWLLPQGHREIS